MRRSNRKTSSGTEEGPPWVDLEIWSPVRSAKKTSSICSGDGGGDDDEDEDCGEDDDDKDDDEDDDGCGCCKILIT